MQLLDMFVDQAIDSAFDKLELQTNEQGYDPWGFHPQSARVYYSIAKMFYHYFRPEIVGIENIPKGKCLIVPNHSGQLPFDGMVVAVSALIDAKPPRIMRSMAERWFPTLPFVNIAFSRSGVVVGDPVNCHNLLQADNAILVFPEGVGGSGKIFQHRYQLAKFGRGFMRLALQADAPIVPVGIVGAEESIISIADLKPIAKMLGMPYLPVPALLPILGPLAMFPLPTKFYIEFGEPMHFEGNFDDEDERIEPKVDSVVKAIEGLIDSGLRKRDGWF